MTNFTVLQDYLPVAWVDSLQALPGHRQDSIQELRLRAGQPVTVSAPEGEWYLCRAGLTALRQRDVFLCTKEMLEACFLRFCQESVYAHEQELRQGFLSVPGGIRVGVAGRVVTQDGEVSALAGVTSLCVRLPRDHRGCAADLLPLVYTGEGVVSSLLVGEPSSGKTSLLRDLCAGLAARRVRVAVVDERGEIAGVNGLSGCDVLTGCPKVAGIRQAVRCLAPQVVVFDELGDEEEIRAVAACAHAGVAVIASLHGRCPEELNTKPVIHRLVEEQVFSRWLFLAGRQTPGQLRECLEPEVMGRDVVWRTADHPGRDRPGTVLFPPLISAGRLFAADRAGAGCAERTADLCAVGHG